MSKRRKPDPDSARLEAALQKLAAPARPADQPPNAAALLGDQYIPFPVDALPAPLRALAVRGAESIGIDPVSVALPGLATLAAAIGTTRTVRIKEDWHEPSILWAALIGGPSDKKSPAFSLATAPLADAQKDYFRAFANNRKRHKEAVEHGERGGDPPVCRRCLLSDVTVDALAVVLQHNPRGILLGCEELDGWFQSFTRYSGGKATDRLRWLGLYGGRMVVVDRKASDPIAAPRAALSDAFRFYRTFYNAFGERIDCTLDGDTRATLGKLEAVALRLALAWELASAADPAAVRSVGLEAIQSGVRLAEWFAAEADRVNGVLGIRDRMKADRDLLDMVRRRDGAAITPRDLRQWNNRRFPTAEVAEVALDELVSIGVRMWEERPAGASGGRPTRRFRATAPADPA